MTKIDEIVADLGNLGLTYLSDLLQKRQIKSHARIGIKLLKESFYVPFYLTFENFYSLFKEKKLPPQAMVALESLASLINESVVFGSPDIEESEDCARMDYFQSSTVSITVGLGMDVEESRRSIRDRFTYNIAFEKV